MKTIRNILGIALTFGALMMLGIFVAKTVIDRSDDGSVKRELDSLKRVAIDLKRGQVEIKAKLDSIAARQTDFKSDLDTLKSGQEIIYEQVKKAAGLSFWDLF